MPHYLPLPFSYCCLMTDINKQTCACVHVTGMKPDLTKFSLRIFTGGLTDLNAVQVYKSEGHHHCFGICMSFIFDIVLNDFYLY